MENHEKRFGLQKIFLVSVSKNNPKQILNIRSSGLTKNSKVFQLEIVQKIFS